MNKLFKNKKIRLLIACISLFLLIDMIDKSYAKYITSAQAIGNLTIAEWNFVVNEQDIISNNNFSEKIVPTFDQNSHIKAGYFAPTSTGYFDIKIDSTKVGVSYDETITLSQDTENTVSDIIFTGYKLNNGELINFQDDETVIHTTHNLDNPNKINTYRVFIEWNDNENEKMNNAADTEASKNGKAIIDININFVQKAREQENNNDTNNSEESNN